MDGAGESQPKIGDVFSCHGEKFKIVDIKNPLGYNEYISQSLYTGHIRTFFIHQVILGLNTSRPPSPSSRSTDISNIDFIEDDIDEILAALQPEMVHQEIYLTKPLHEAKSEPESRFLSVDEGKLADLENKRNEDTTIKQTKWGVNLFKSWLSSRNLDVNFETTECNVLNSLLRQFYAEARTQKGEKYSKSALVSIRACLNRYLISPPFSRPICIMRDKAFMTSNHVLHGMVKEMKREGLDKTQHKTAIPDTDIQKCYSTGVLSNETPTSLQLKVWFEISLHMGRRGREGLCDLTKNSFLIKVDDAGNKYVEMSYNESDKTHHGIDSKENIKKPRMYATGQENCPLKSFEFYVSKLHPKCNRFFQRPKVRLSDNENEIWYDNMAVGKNKMGNFMKIISERAGLSAVYTNHCIRATLVTKLHHAGVDSVGIMSISGHRNEKSLQSYVKEPSSAQRKQYSHILSSATPSCDNEGNVVSPTYTENAGKSNRDVITETNLLESRSLFQNARISATGNINIAINLHSTEK